MYCRMSMVTLIDRTFRVMSFSYKHQDFSNNQLKWETLKSKKETSTVFVQAFQNENTTSL